MPPPMRTRARMPTARPRRRTLPGRRHTRQRARSGRRGDGKESRHPGTGPDRVSTGRHTASLRNPPPSARRPLQSRLRFAGFRQRRTCRSPSRLARFPFPFPGSRIPFPLLTDAPDDLRRDHHWRGPRRPLPRPAAAPGASGHHGAGRREEEAPGAGGRPQGRRVERRDRRPLLLQDPRSRASPGRASALQAGSALLLHRRRQP